MKTFGNPVESCDMTFASADQQMPTITSEIHPISAELKVEIEMFSGARNVNSVFQSTLFNTDSAFTVVSDEEPTSR